MILPAFEVKKKTPIAVIFAALLVMLAAFSLPAAPQAGPPFIGDDPGTPATATGRSKSADRRAASRYSSVI